ncbi:AAA family ATPase [Brevundimonas sp. PAMC22021]|uniref:AAA family ATPase n=1 Tax=Brevundimonas sp. PAMC22021 TaxID=2861285 RepID=UPI001C633C85|nr:AAA family ATPase [Brevundimonas sp. PAMC22021]QYF86208.1 AAA family ATPase [Brevundimonas sp. PAMC22021]
MELLSATDERQSQTGVRREGSELRHSSILDGLAHLFRGRCAFCEAATQTRPYRFRPASEARPPAPGGRSHLYYVWLAEDWDNIYAICDLCDPEQPDLFAVTGPRMPIPSPEALRGYVDDGAWPQDLTLDRPVLLDPCRDRNFTTHLEVRGDGAILGLSTRGRPTVGFFNLNHPRRVAERRDAFNSRLVDLRHIATRPFDETGRDRLRELLAFQELPFGGAWRLYLRRLVIELRRRMGEPAAAAQSGMERFLIGFVQRRDAVAALDDAVATVEEFDAAVDAPASAIRRSAHNKARLARVEVSNFKGVEDLSFEVGDVRSRIGGGDAPSLIILGENAAGKSTILEAIAMAMSDRKALDQLKIDPVDYRLDPTMMGGKGRPRTHSGVKLRFDDGEDRLMRISARGLSAEGRSDLPPVFAYGAFRQYVDRTRRYSAARSVMSLFKTDALLSKPERWLMSLDEERFDAVVRTLRPILSISQDFDVVRRDPVQDRCMVVFQTPSRAGLVETLTPLTQVSSGFRSVLAMMCDLLEGMMHHKVNPGFTGFSTARGVLLIDEIEAHLHPRWKMQIMRGLRTALPQMTIIATTHDPLCLRGMDDGEVMVLHRVAGAETTDTDLPVFVERLTELPGVSRLTVQQLLTSDFFSLFSTDSPEAETDLARIADLLAAQAAGRVLSDRDLDVLRAFERDVASALPVGSSQVHRLVQSAVAEYLAAKRDASDARLRRLRHETRQAIVDALERV